MVPLIDKVICDGFEYVWVLGKSGEMGYIVNVGLELVKLDCSDRSAIVRELQTGEVGRRILTNGEHLSRPSL